MEKIKWGIIGLGSIANQFAAQFQSEDAELVAVASRNLQKAFEFSQKHTIKKAYGSYQELAYDPEIDIVYVATPNSAHFLNILMLLKAGKHILCEKPMTLNRRQLTKILELAETKKLVVAEAMTIYHMPIFKEIKTHLETQKYGRLTKIHADFGVRQKEDDSNRFYAPALGGGALYDIGVYALSFIRYFLSSQPDTKQTTVSFSSTGVDAESTFYLENRQGEIGTASLSFKKDMPIQGLIVCENATIKVPDFPRASQAIVTFSDGTSEIIEAGVSSRALVYEMEAITQTLLSGTDLTYLPLTRDVNEIINWAIHEWNMDWALD